ncbi:hypothetical protein [Mycolicibacterium frederiksbergense]|uniref:hypothetical protein n=1 Tax=Mycolicibacterium frederiksbergense TaxID=117567 RepID=UPI00265B8A18|nr:hypothetical protein [Mycolicibacterium frederiksbergense]MDO0974858.1 hypothetical protein [Mycolicibacterium frederiksbergense]
MTKKRTPFRTLAAFAAGLHAANGLAHGVQPSAHSAARTKKPPGWSLRGRLARGSLVLPRDYASSEAGGLKRSP